MPKPSRRPQRPKKQNGPVYGGVKFPKLPQEDLEVAGAPRNRPTPPPARPVAGPQRPTQVGARPSARPVAGPQRPSYPERIGTPQRPVPQPIRAPQRPQVAPQPMGPPQPVLRQPTARPVVEQPIFGPQRPAYPVSFATPGRPTQRPEAPALAPPVAAPRPPAQEEPQFARDLGVAFPGRPSPVSPRQVAPMVAPDGTRLEYMPSTVPVATIPPLIHSAFPTYARSIGEVLKPVAKAAYNVMRPAFQQPDRNAAVPAGVSGFMPPPLGAHAQAVQRDEDASPIVKTFFGALDVLDRPRRALGEPLMAWFNDTLGTTEFWKSQQPLRDKFDALSRQMGSITPTRYTAQGIYGQAIDQRQQELLKQQRGIMWQMLKNAWSPEQLQERALAVAGMSPGFGPIQRGQIDYLMWNLMVPREDRQKVIDDYIKYTPAAQQFIEQAISDPLNAVDLPLTSFRKVLKYAEIRRYFKAAMGVTNGAAMADIARAANSFKLLGKEVMLPKLMRLTDDTMRSFVTREAVDMTNQVFKTAMSAEGVNSHWVFKTWLLDPDNPDLVRLTGGLSASLPAKRAAAVWQKVMGVVPDSRVEDAMRKIGNVAKQLDNADNVVAELTEKARTAKPKAVIHERVKKAVTKAEELRAQVAELREAAPKTGDIDFTTFLEVMRKSNEKPYEAVVDLVEMVEKGSEAYFPIKAATTGGKVKQAINQFYATLLLGYNPGFAIRNMSNNIVTMAAYGIDITKIFDTNWRTAFISRFQTMPTVMRQGFTGIESMAGISRAQLMADMNKGMQIWDVFKGVSLKNNPTAAISGGFEQLAREVTTTDTMWKTWRDLWPKRVREVEQALMGTGLTKQQTQMLMTRFGQSLSPQELVGALQSLLNPDDLARIVPPNLLDEVERAGGPTLAATVESAASHGPQAMRVVQQAVESVADSADTVARVSKVADDVTTVLADDAATMAERTAAIRRYFADTREMWFAHEQRQQARNEAVRRITDVMKDELARADVFERYWSATQKAGNEMLARLNDLEAELGPTIGMSQEAITRRQQYRAGMGRLWKEDADRTQKTVREAIHARQVLHDKELANRLWEARNAKHLEYRIESGRREGEYIAREQTDITEAIENYKQKHAGKVAEAVAPPPAAAAETPPVAAAAPAEAAPEAVPPAVAERSIAEGFTDGVYAKSAFEGGEVTPDVNAAWRSMGPKEFDSLMGGAAIGGPAKGGKKGGYFSWYPEYSAKLKGSKGKPKYLVEFRDVGVEAESTVRPVSRADVSAIWRSEGGEWERFTPEAAVAEPAQAAAPSPASAVEQLQAEATQRVQGTINVADISVNPDRFQFKTEAQGTGGVTNQFKNVKTWRPEFGKGISVWIDPADGKTYVVNGHHRVELAQRLGVQTIDAPYYIQAATDREARFIGATQNIAEGRGTAIDAAKLFRETGLTVEVLDNLGLALTEGVVRDGMALANLHDSLFGMVFRREMTVERGAIIGRKVPNKDMQLQLVQELDKQIAKGKKVTNDVVSELGDAVTSGPAETFEQVGLFGAEETTQSLAFEKAEFYAYVRNKLAREKRLFGFASENAGELSRVGDINAAQATGISEAAASLLDAFDIVKNQRNVVSQIADEAAAAIAKGGDLNKVKEGYYARIIDSLPDVISGRGATLGDVAGAGAGGLAATPGTTSAATEQLTIPVVNKPDKPELVGYTWRSHLGERYSSYDGGLVGARVSDWEKAEISELSGRKIVHIYHILGTDGIVRPHGKYSALKALGENTSEGMLDKAANKYMREVLEKKAAAKAGLDEFRSKLKFASPQDAVVSLRKMNTGAIPLSEITILGKNDEYVAVLRGTYLEDTALSDGWKPIETPGPPSASSGTEGSTFDFLKGESGQIALSGLYDAGDAARATAHYMRQWWDQLVAHTSTPNPIAALTPEQYDAILPIINEQLIPKMTYEKAFVNKYAQEYGNLVLGDYTKRRGFHAFLGNFFPYSYWYYFTYGNWAKLLATHPSYLAHYGRYREMLYRINTERYREETGDPNAELPPQYARLVRFPFAGTQWGMNLEANLMPLTNLLSDFTTRERQEAPLGKVASAISEIGPSLYPHIYWLYSAWLASQGHTDAAQQWAGYAAPFDRPLRSATALLREKVPATGIAIPEGGLSLSGAFGILHNVRGGDWWERRKNPNYLIQLLNEGVITPTEAANAAYFQNDNQEWKDALQRQSVKLFLPRIVGFMGGPGLKAREYSDIELDKMWQERNVVYESKGKPGVSDQAYRQMWKDLDKKYPFMALYVMARITNPIERLEQFSWMVLERIPPGDKKQPVLDAAGLTRAMIDKFYATKGDIAKWTPEEQAAFKSGIEKLATTVLQPTAQQEMAYNRVQTLSQQVAAAAAKVAGVSVDEWYNLSNEYFSLPKAEQKAWLAQHPAFSAGLDAKQAAEDKAGKEYWDFYGFPGGEKRKAALDKYGAKLLSEAEAYLDMSKEERAAARAKDKGLYARIEAVLGVLLGPKEDGTTTSKSSMAAKYDAAEQRFGSQVAGWAKGWKNMTPEQKAAFKKNNPDGYKRLQAYWDYVYGNTQPQYPQRSYGGGGGGWSGGGGYGGGGQPTPVAPTPVTPSPTSQPWFTWTESDFNGRMTTVRAADPTFDQLVTAMFGGNIMSLLLAWLRMTPEQRQAYIASNPAEWGQVSRFMGWFYTLGATPATSTTPLIPSVPQPPTPLPPQSVPENAPRNPWVM